MVQRHSHRKALNNFYFLVDMWKRIFSFWLGLLNAAAEDSLLLSCSAGMPYNVPRLLRLLQFYLGGRYFTLPFSKESYNSTYIHNFSAPENGWLNKQTLMCIPERQLIKVCLRRTVQCSVQRPKVAPVGGTIQLDWPILTVLASPQDPSNQRIKRLQL